MITFRRRLLATSPSRACRESR